jgi:hypothetical protein
MTAFRKLRQEGDPVAAAALLDRYLEESPDGALVEEALALRIEAAVALHKNVAELVDRYQTKFPDGRFRERAKNALKAPVD